MLFGVTWKKRHFKCWSSLESIQRLSQFCENTKIQIGNCRLPSAGLCWESEVNDVSACKATQFGVFPIFSYIFIFIHWQKSNEFVYPNAFSIFIYFTPLVCWKKKILFIIFKFICYFHVLLSASVPNSHCWWPFIPLP